METAPSGKVSSAHVLAALAGLWLLLWSASVLQDVIIWTSGTEAKVWLLDVDVERSFYTWFSTLLLAFGGLLALVLSAHRDPTGPDFRLHWRVLGLGFLFLSMDEMLSFHEKLAEVLSGQLSTSGVFTFVWVLPALAILPVLGVVFVPFLLGLPRRVGVTIVIAAALFLGGAVGMEMIAGLVISEQDSMEAGIVTPAYRALVNIEEGLEGLGAIVFIHALLMQCGIYFPHVFAERKAGRQEQRKA